MIGGTGWTYLLAASKLGRGMDLRLSAAGVPFASGSSDGACPVSLLLRAGMPPERHTSFRMLLSMLPQPLKI